MNSDIPLNFEILAIDKFGNAEISTESSMVHGLLFMESLWEAPEDQSNYSKHHYRIHDSGLGIDVIIQSVDTSNTLNDLIESAFLINIWSSNFENLEKFRFKLIKHLKAKLSFSNLKILKDDVSAKIAVDIYPLVNEVENSLRRYITKFFTLKIGVNWWSTNFPKQLIDKIRVRKEHDNIFSGFVDLDVSLIDFNELGEVIYKHVAGFNRQENIVNKIMQATSPDDFLRLKGDLQTNYNKFFKTAFQDNLFEKKWRELFSIRNKVAHNIYFSIEELIAAKKLHSELMLIISQAESGIDEFRFSITEQEAIREATIEAFEESDFKLGELNSESRGGLKILGKINLNQRINNDDDETGKIITEEQLLRELNKSEAITENSDNFQYLGLRSFVTRILANKGYAMGPTYALVNILKDKGVIEIYEVKDENVDWPVKAIKIKR